MMEHFISLNDWSATDIIDLLDSADRLKADFHAKKQQQPLLGCTLGMIFSKPSTRTRVSFESGMFQLGGHALFLSSSDIQLGRGEPIMDTAHILSRYLDVIMIRTSSHQDVEEFARYSAVPVINALTDYLHPCQVLADLQTIREEKGRLAGLKLAYIGDGNNMANSLLHGCSKMGISIALATPENFAPDSACVANAKANALISGCEVVLTRDPKEAVAGADIVYTDTWISMGMESEKQARINQFMGYTVNSGLMSLADKEAIFLHCLPAYRGYEVDSDIIDGPCSRVYEEAENRLHAQKALLLRLIQGRNPSTKQLC